MIRQKFTVVLIPDEDGYQVIVPHYSGCTTWGKTPEEAFANAKEAMELLLELEAEQNGAPVPYNVHASHVVVGEIDVEVPDSLIEKSETAAVETRA
jgi:predicted RNase H-like HicB family nuclease